MALATGKAAPVTSVTADVAPAVTPATGSSSSSDISYRGIECETSSPSSGFICLNFAGSNCSNFSKSLRVHHSAIGGGAVEKAAAADSLQAAALTVLEAASALKAYSETTEGATAAAAAAVGSVWGERDGRTEAICEARHSAIAVWSI